MTWKNCCIFFVSILILTGLAYAHEESGLSVTDMKFCTDVQDREPIGIDSIFSSTAEQIYCFTLIEDAEDTTFVSHVWYFNDEKIAEVSLKIGPARWRTWSSKKIMKEWVGKWRVDIVSGDIILRSEEFHVQD